jgi:hypothetical protein
MFGNPNINALSLRNNYFFERWQKIKQRHPINRIGRKKMEKSRQSMTIKQMRMDLAKEFQADNTCPLTTGIYLRIVAEYAYEQIKNGIPMEEVAPFWRVIDGKSKLARKVSFGYTIISDLR